jgi:hypothetical protein
MLKFSFQWIAGSSPAMTNSFERSSQRRSA